ncbi:serine hydrolase domain-containing protein [Celeribacter neptunius]|uniref:CubicO group peptidase, beta-lactamase class C family n=1 Tax=Celeribacter neptunius TaxID=588602 RepID=A0A1I3ISY6_9RHOB|nr:serine hydrolase domain-containing protein [Celeribacter neptunius]SFI51012.1 CubicO group peptidase, beta-lactamase class C family [Celeribacter neptunius]
MRKATARLQRLADKLTATDWHNGVAISIFDQATGAELHIGSGELDTRTPFFATHITKLFVSAIILQFVTENRLSLEDKMIDHIGYCSHCKELHVIDGVDYTDQITIRHLMSHTSGLGDFFLFKMQARSLRHSMIDGIDSSWSFEEVMQRARSHGGIAIPGESKKATYTESNYQLLGRIIENIEGKSLAEVIRDRIAGPLGLSSTYLYCDPSDHRPLNLMSRNREVYIPRAMASFQADGGVVTTAREGLIFIRAFFEGYLFDKAALPLLYDWRPLFFPARFGVGLLELQVPRWMALRHRLRMHTRHIFKRPPLCLGTVGLGNAVFLYAPDEGVYISGTANQLVDPERSVSLALRAIEEVARYGRHEVYGEKGISAQPAIGLAE